jgi:methylated-DNA-protein-cysteine methyltransferase-like protein
MGKSGPDFSPIRPLFQEHFLKPTGFWEMLLYHNRQFWLKIGGKHGISGGKMTESTLRIIQALKAVPYGRVSSYRDIALAAELPNGARQVARILHSLSRSQNLPWHRIIRADGRIALPSGAGKEAQIALLRAEGVRVSKAGTVAPGYFTSPRRGRGASAGHVTNFL